jgi:hypothetical protein
MHYRHSHSGQCDGEMRNNGNLSGKFSDEYERLYPSILASWSNVSISSNSASVVILFMLGHPFISAFKVTKRGLSMTSDSSLVQFILATISILDYAL